MKDTVYNYRGKKTTATSRPGPVQTERSLTTQQSTGDHQHVVDVSPMLRYNLQEIT